MRLRKPSAKPAKRRVGKHGRERRKAILQLDALARAEVFARDNELCQRCLDPYRKVQWAHMISRRHLCIRWESDNALSLCAGCHMWFDGYPLLSGDWFKKNYPDRAERILAMFNKGGKIDPVALLAERRGVAERAGM